jgi:hypothetical protein
MRKDDGTMIDLIFQTALHASGDQYLRAEAELIARGQEAEQFLAGLPQSADPWTRQFVAMLRQRVAGQVDFLRCLEFFDDTETRTAPTAQGEPVPEWVAARLEQDFGGRVAPLLGIYLLKLEQLWPYWKTAGSLLYLERLPPREVSVFLLEFVLKGRSNQFRSMARKALLAKPDPGLLAEVTRRLQGAEEAAATLRQLAEELGLRQA